MLIYNHFQLNTTEGRKSPLLYLTKENNYLAKGGSKLKLRMKFL
jgi:hypothetical protein